MGGTGWDYVYHAQYAPNFDDQVIETVENTGIKYTKDASRLGEKVRRFIEYEVKKALEAKDNGKDHKISEFTASSVVFQNPLTANFYRAEADFLKFVVALFGEWQAKGEELAGGNKLAGEKVPAKE